MTTKAKLQAGGDGTAVPAGMVGEVKTSYGERSFANSMVSARFYSYAALTLTPGVWLITARCTPESNVFTGPERFSACISTYNTDDANRNAISAGTAYAGTNLTFGDYYGPTLTLTAVVSPTASTTYYARAACQATVGAGTTYLTGGLTAVRIA